MSQGNLSGQTLAQYQLRELLGVGGMGAVYRAYQVNLKREVAVKIISPDLLANTEAMARFIREAEISAQLEHPNIVTIHDFGTSNRITYVVMRLLTGGSLARRIEQRIEDARPLISLGETADLLRQVASALDYAHNHGVIHRDIKPANIMFDNQGKPYIVDFGIAKLTGKGTAYTQAGTAMGTPNYMPPEQWRGEELTPNADQYALAVMTYQLLTGRMPFDGDSAFVLMHKHLNEQPTPLNILRPDIPPAVMIVINRAMAKDYRQRFPSCTAFAQAFESAIEGNKGQATGMFVFKVRPSQTGAIPMNNRPYTPTGSGIPAYNTKPPRSNAQNPLIWGLGLALIVIFVLLLVILGDGGGNNSATPTTVAQNDLSPTTSSITILSSPTETPQPEETERLLPTNTLTDMPSATATATDTLPPTDTATIIATLDIQQAAIGTRERIATITAESWTDTPTPDVDATIVAEITRLYFVELTMTATLWTTTPTVTLTHTPTATLTHTPTVTLTHTPTATLTHTPTDTAIPTRIATNTPMPTVMPTQSTFNEQQEPFLIWADEEYAPLILDIGSVFEITYGVEIEVQEIGLIDARDLLLINGPLGDGPDVMIISSDSIGSLVANGAIVPLELGGLANSFIPSALNTFTYQNQLWALPYTVENVALIRNVDLVPQAPKTWQDVRVISEQLIANGHLYGFVAQTGNPYHVFPIFSAFGGYVFGFNEDGTYNIADIGLNSEGGIAAATWLSEMYRDDLMPQNIGDDEMFELFTSGDAAMLITGPWYSQRIKDSALQGGFNYAIDPLPGAEGISEIGSPFNGGRGFVISAYSNNQLLAETFLLDFIATQEVMQHLSLRIPAFEGVVHEDPNITLFQDAGVVSIPMPQIPEMGYVWTGWGNNLTRISQDYDPVEAMNNAVQEINESLALGQSTSDIVVLAGNMQSTLGCSGDWNPACTVTQLTLIGNGIYQATFTIPTGDYEYKIALNGGWDINYGANCEANGANIAISLTAETAVTFTFDQNKNFISDSVNQQTDC